MAKKICDFCLSESKGLFGGHEKLADGHHICKNCKSIIRNYGLEVKYDLFQKLVTAQPNLTDMIMDAWLEDHSPEEELARFYPEPSILLHDGEHCMNELKASITVKKDSIPETVAPAHIAEISKKTINDIPDTLERKDAQKVEGTLYETEVALYFMSDHFINCHRLGYVKRNMDNNDRISVVTPKYAYTYRVSHADLFFLRERFYQKCNAAKNNKQQHLIYISNDNEFTITPGVYDIPKLLRPGRYRVKAINDAGLHVRDSLGRVRDYYESEEAIDISEGSVLECTGEYRLEWIGEKE